MSIPVVVVVACAICVFARAQETTQPSATEAAGATTAPAATATPPAEEAFNLKSAVERFWHYGKVGRYDVANAEGSRILSSGTDPNQVLVAFEQNASEKKDNLDQILLRFQNVAELRDTATKITALLEQGRQSRRADPKFITTNIERLAAGERAYTNAIGRLRQSGELSLPFMIDYLRDPSKQQYHVAIRRALRDMGKYALAPLCAATEMKDYDTLVTIVTALGDLGYDAAAPYLARLANAEVPTSVRAAATESLLRLGTARAAGAGAVRGPSAADLFNELAEKQFYGKSSITADNRFPIAYIWYWGDNGLTKKDVPPAIFNDLMTMRATEYALKLGGGQGDALSLWLAANYRREVDLPEGATDVTRAENQPDAHYYGVVTGSQYLDNALARALRDRNSPVAMKVIKSLHEIAGQSNLFKAVNSRPLIDAMQYPDRLVRFEAAFALAAALPQTQFQGQDLVVPLLAEAMAQTGQPSVLLVMQSQNDVNALVDAMKAGEQGFMVVGATNADQAIATAVTLPAVDVIVVSEDFGPQEVDRFLGMVRQNARLQGAARLVITKTGASRYEEFKSSDPLLSTTQARDAENLKNAITEARKKGGALPLDPAIATDYATRAGELLLKVAISRGQVFDLMAAKPTLLQSLVDKRPNIVMLGGQVTAMLNDRDAQGALLATASDEKTADDVKISLYKSLAVSAKFWGNLLDANQVQTLQKVVDTATNLQVRSAAAEAHGALNLPADQAKKLIVEQSKV
jgi:HEAT repeat protein